jgi:hypothetical protein
VTEQAEAAGVDLTEHGEAAYALREHGRHATPPLEAMSPEELEAMHERLVLDATERVLEAIGTEPPDRERRPAR